MDAVVEQRVCRIFFGTLVGQDEGHTEVEAEAWESNDDKHPTERVQSCNLCGNGVQPHAMVNCPLRKCTVCKVICPGHVPSRCPARSSNLHVKAFLAPVDNNGGNTQQTSNTAGTGQNVQQPVRAPRTLVGQDEGHTEVEAEA